ncbi:hypothetical protein HYPSUDRAFT_420127 [Hypholoma sublateritium FD-334 SS-4]|uniref:Uncharacterized protein n=1 Tax=Hypholoma sublateritium (strain FD-334 SS-4) TaxID=945553 RepID=A0A0D2Q155_HYPSF|nr:hypothetical protein HYPSUDRAFT_420127 [Hypholoma sublateritium FD-334 SS-4]
MRCWHCRHRYRVEAPLIVLAHLRRRIAIFVQASAANRQARRRPILLSPAGTATPLQCAYAVTVVALISCVLARSGDALSPAQAPASLSQDIPTEIHEIGRWTVVYAAEARPCGRGSVRFDSDARIFCSLPYILSANIWSLMGCIRLIGIRVRARSAHRCRTR